MRFIATSASNPYEGDRFKVADAADYYSIACTLTGMDPSIPAFGVLDEEDGGYIAFTTNERHAEQIVQALMLVEVVSRWRERTFWGALQGSYS